MDMDKCKACSAPMIFKSGNHQYCELCRDKKKEEAKLRYARTRNKRKRYNRMVVFDCQVCGMPFVRRAARHKYCHLCAEAMYIFAGNAKRTQWADLTEEAKNRHLDRAKEKQAQECKNLEIPYVKRLLCQRTNLHFADIPFELAQAKQFELKIRRYLKDENRN